MATVSTAEHDEYQRLAEQLALMPEVIARLAYDHVPDDSGRCRGCTSGGTGYPSAHSPCTLQRLATMALAIRKRTDRPSAARRPALAVRANARGTSRA